MKIKDCQNFNAGFVKIMNGQINFKLAYRLTKIMKKIEGELAAAQSGIKVLFEKYGEKDDKGGTQIKPENLEVFQKESAELMEQEVKIDFEPIPISILETLDKVEPQALFLLIPFVDENPIKELPNTTKDK